MQSRTGLLGRAALLSLSLLCYGSPLLAQPTPGRITQTSRLVLPGNLGPSAWVVSEVTVKKVVDTKEAGRIREILQGVDPSLYQITINDPRSTATKMGSLALSDVVQLDRAIARVPSNNAAFVVSEVTVKKVVDTKQLQELKSALEGVDRKFYNLSAVRLERLTP